MKVYARIHIWLDELLSGPKGEELQEEWRERAKWELADIIHDAYEQGRLSVKYRNRMEEENRDS